MSYVLTSSNNFNDTLEKIIAGLNSAGFSRKDFRSVDAADMLPPPEETPAPTPLPAPPHSDFESGEGEDFLNFDESSIATELSQREHGNQQDSVPNPATGLAAADEQMFRIDVDAKGDVPRAFRMSATDQRFMREHFATLSFESQKNQAAGAIYDQLKRINSINDSDLKAYIERVVDNFDSSDMLSYQEHPRAVAEKIRTKIYGLLNEHKVKTFYEWIETGRITTEPHFMFPPAIQPVHASSMIGGSLYRGEDRMNNYEMEIATRFSAMENLRWWHRNIDRKGLCINGHINHYPDFILMTESGVIVLVEPKGEQLKNDDSRQKLKLGRTWAQNAGANFRYYMVFNDGVTPLEGAHTLSEFLHILEQL